MKYINIFIKKTLKVIGITENIICGIGLWVTTILVFCAIVNRYFLHFPIMWFNDLALYCFIFFMLITSSLTTREKGHTSVDVFRQKVFEGKPRANTIYSIFLNSVSIVVVVIFLPATWRFMLRAIKYPEYSTLLRWFNTSWLMSTLFIAMLLILVHLFTLLVKDIGQLKKMNVKYRGGKK
ncbi:MAG: TRAP transporter small permease subunit [Candidatus Atribacteria bacterium]|nr:TRAP transporter small permease subunit [Candidatus Atribacteria bacterium]